MYGAHTVPCSESRSFIVGNRANQPCRIAAATVSIAGRSPWYSVHWNAVMPPSIASGSLHSSPCAA